MEKREEIKEFILKNISGHPRDINRFVVQKFEINRKTVVDYLKALIDEGLLEAEGRTKARNYKLKVLEEKIWPIEISPKSEEHQIWRETIANNLSGLPENVRGSCQLFGCKLSPGPMALYAVANS